MPKFYFYDVGLACYLLGIENPKQLVTHPLRGELFENLQITEAIKWRFNDGKRENIYFYRDSYGTEIDLVLDLAGRFLPIEIKVAQTYTSNFEKGLKSFRKNKIECLDEGGIVMGSNDSQKRSGLSLIPWRGLERYLDNVYKNESPDEGV